MLGIPAANILNLLIHTLDEFSVIKDSIFASQVLLAIQASWNTTQSHRLSCCEIGLKAALGMGLLLENKIFLAV